jgi:integrase
MPQRAKSIAEHALHGTTPGAKNSATQSGIPSGRPKFPRHLPANLRPVFKATCKMLETRRALTEADGPLLSLYCKAFARALGEILASVGERYRPLFTLLAGTGLRIGEALGLKTSDLSPDCRMLYGAGVGRNKSLKRPVRYAWSIYRTCWRDFSGRM